jgi:hypothetical protein
MRQGWLAPVSGLIGVVLGSLIGLGATYIGPYLQNRITGRDHLANALASYYAAAASEFYAQQELNKANLAKINKSSEYYRELMKENDQHYQEFLAATTHLSVEAPKSLQKRVLDTEDEWDDIYDNLDEAAETRWFKDLDDIRQTILDSLPPRGPLDETR